MPLVVAWQQRWWQSHSHFEDAFSVSENPQSYRSINKKKKEKKKKISPALHNHWDNAPNHQLHVWLNNFAVEKVEIFTL